MSLQQSSKADDDDAPGNTHLTHILAPACVWKHIYMDNFCMV